MCIRDRVQALKILKGVKGISFVELNKKDIVRHKLVTQIVEAYEKFDKEAKAAVSYTHLYQGVSSTGVIKEVIGINEDLTDRTVVIVEDLSLIHISKPLPY